MYCKLNMVFTSTMARTNFWKGKTFLTLDHLVLFCRLASVCGVTLNPVALIQVPKRRTISESDGVLESIPSSNVMVTNGSVVVNGSVLNVANKMPSPGYTDKVSSSWNGLSCERQMSWPASTTDETWKKAPLSPAPSFANVATPKHQSQSNENSIVLEMNSLPS